jgi:glycosyltransferase involved in cell wall biosynthesis
MTRRLAVDVVVVNYVFLSEALVDIDPALVKIIITHDVFTDRQTIRGGTATPGIPLTAQQESMGLSRADLLVAITDDDRRFFAGRLNQPDVITLPFIPRFQPLRPREGSGAGSVLTVGFLGSAHWPNISAIRAFIAAGNEQAGFSLLIGGKVCDSLRHAALPGYVQLLGRQLSVEWFYRRCHLIVNPDMFQSGQKVKTVEALAYGMPLICTLTAASGLPSTSRYHQAESADACFHLVEEIVRQPERLELLRQESITLYRNLREHYLESSGGGLIGAVERKRAVKLMKPGPA